MIKELKSEFEDIKTSHKDFVFFQGDKQILISAPHAVYQLRNGNLKLPEPETALIALLLNKMGYPCIIKTTNENDDANYDESSNYKDKIQDICNSQDIKFILDLHQINKFHIEEFCIGTGKNVFNNLLNYSYLKGKILDHFYLNGFIAKLDEPFSASSNNTISGYFARRNIPSLQLEMNTKLLYQVTDDKFMKAFDSVCGIIHIIENEF